MAKAIEIAAGHPARSVEQILDDIGSRREAISSTIRELDDRVHRALDWRTHVSRHPLAAAGIAAGVGTAAVLILWRPRRDPWERVADAVVDTVEGLRWELGDSFENIASGLRGHSRRKTRPDDNRPTARGAVAAAIATAALNFMGERLTRSDPARHAHPEVERPVRAGGSLD